MNNLKIQKYHDLFNAFNKSFKNSLDSFFNLPNDKSLSKKIKDIVSHIDEISKSTKEQLKKSQKYCFI